MKKKVAIIGGGQIADRVHVPYYLSRPELEVVAVVNPCEDSARSFAEKNGIPRYYTDASVMLNNENPDIVSVCTPNRYHYEYVMEALSHGCHVLCEKPPAITAQEAYEMYKLAEKKNLVLGYNFHHRFSDDVNLLRKKIQQGELGNVYVVKVKALRRSGIPGWGNFTNKYIQGGGPLIDIGVHMLDSAFYVLGFPKIKKVTAKMFQEIGNKKSKGTLGSWDPTKFEVEDSFFGFIELENDGLVLLETSFALNMKESSVMNVEFFGDRAGATLFPAEIYTDQDGKLVHIYQKDTTDQSKYQKSMAAFVDKCLGKDTMIANGYEGYFIQNLIEALYLSAEKGESIIL